MRKFNILTTLFAMLFFIGITNAQVNSYLFSSSSGTYTPITGGTIHGTTTNDDNNFTSIPIGFSFIYNGTAYANISINTNGFIAMGTAITSSYTSLSTGTSNNVIAGLNRDLQGQTGSEIMTLTEGVSPNQVFTVQWTNYRCWNTTGDSYNFQIKLYETSNVVEFVYGSFTQNATNRTIQVGLRGGSNADFNNRTTTTDWSATTAGGTNAANCALTSTVFPASGLTFSFTPASCSAPNTLAVSNITTTSADFSWVAPGTGTPINYEWKVVLLGAGSGGTAVDNGTVANPTVTASTSLLSAATTYDLFVRTDCGAGDFSGWAGPITFTTNCAIATPVWSEDFTTYVPVCWYEAVGALTNNTTFTSTTSSAWAADGFGNIGTTGSAKLNIFGTTRKEWLISPSIDLGTGAYQMEFDLALTVWNATTPSALGVDDSLVLIISTDNGATWSSANIVRAWTSASSISATGDHIVVNLSAYSGVVKFGFYGKSSVTNADNDVFIDNVLITNLASCPAPSALTASNITTNTADLSWTLGGTETAWNLEWGPFGFVQGSGTTVAVNTTALYNLTGLSASTQYSYYVQADCGGTTSTWVGPFSFTTACDVISTFPWVENFGATLPLCWTNTPSTNNDMWLFGIPGGGGGTNPAGWGATADHTTGTGYVAWVDDSQTQLANPDVLTTPVFDLTGLTNPELRFWYWIGNNSANTSTLQVDVFDGTTWQTNVGSYTQNGMWQEVIININAYKSANSQIRFVANEHATDFYSDITLDDVSISEAPTCPAPSSIISSNVTTTGADLAWTPGGSETGWNIEYGPAGFSLGTGTPGTPNTPSYSATGLTASTLYDFYVQADCGGGDLSAWVGPYTFATACDLATIPYTETFDGPAIPICWTQSFDGTLTSNRWTLETTNTAGGTANEMVASWQTGIGVSRLIAPAFNTVGISNLMVSYITFFDDFAAGATIKIQSSSDGITWTDEGTPFATGNGNIPSGTVITVPITQNLGGTTYIAWVIDGDHYQYDGWSIDNINIKVPSSDAQITAFSFVEQTGPATFSASLPPSIDIEVAPGTDVTNLVPTITVSPFATINPLSGVAQDFSAPFVYTVTAEDGVTTLDWTINVTVAPYSLVMWNFPNNPDDAVADGGIAANLSKTITTVGTNPLAFNVAGATTFAATANGWDAGMDTKYWEVEFETLGYKDITVSSKQKSSNTGPKDFKAQYKVGLAGTWTDIPGATIVVANDAFVSGTLSNAVLPVDANNQASVYVRWIMTSNTAVGGAAVAGTGTSRMDDLIVTGNLLSTETEILTFDIPSQGSSSVGANVVDITYCGTDVTALSPTITLSTGATISPASGTPQDFTNPVTYTVTAEDGFTTSSWVVTVNASPLPTITLTSPSAVTICEGSTTDIILEFTGTGPWTWIGDDGSGQATFNVTSSPFTAPANPTVNTTYSIISVTDATGCSNTSTESVVVTVDPTSVGGTATATDQNVCPNSGTVITLTGYTGSIQWQSSSDGTTWADLTGETSDVLNTGSLTAGTYYQAVVTSGVCTDATSNSEMVNVYTVAPVTVTETTGVLSSDATSGNQWYEQVTGILTGETNQTYTPSVDGNYYVIVTDANGCTTMSNVYSFILSLSDNSLNSDLNVYPNPAKGKVFVEVLNPNNSEMTVELITMDGRVLVENSTSVSGKYIMSIDLSDYASGVYMIKVVSENSTLIQKLVIQ